MTIGLDAGERVHDDPGRAGPAVLPEGPRLRTAVTVFFGALDEMATNWILSRRRYVLADQADEIVDPPVGGLGTPAKGAAR